MCEIADCEKPFAEGERNGVAGAVHSAAPITAKGDAYCNEK
jgi:hypothetical protein